MDTLAATDGSNAWQISGANAGTLNSTTVFSGISNLTGGMGNDSFTLAGGTLSGSINGGAGINTLTGDNGANSWTVTGANTGTVTGVSGTFSNIQNLVGGSSNDSFVFSNAATLAGTVDGGAGGINTLDFTAYSTSVGITLTGSNPFGYSGTTSGSPNPTGGFAQITAIDLPALANEIGRASWRERV